MAELNRDRINIPASPACGQWETLLVDAMDGQLRAEDVATFSGHLASCPSCAEMFEQVRRGREWLAFLAPEPEVPSYLLEKILSETGHGKADPARFASTHLAPAGASDGIAIPPVWQRPGFAGNMRRFAEPRLLMTAAMAFFSIALTLSMTGVRFTGLKMADLRPGAVRSAVEKRIMTASTPFIRYYDHLRFVYEVESTMRELRRNSESQQQNQKKDQPGSGESHKKDGGSRVEPEQANPDQAPQQTVNPPDARRSGEILEVAFKLSSNDRQARYRRGAQAEEINVDMNAPKKGFSTLTRTSGWLKIGFKLRAGLKLRAVSNRSGSLRTQVSALPERSQSCLA